MEQQKIKKLEQLFSQFAQEEQASSFAVQNLLNITIQIIEDGEIERLKNNEKSN